MSLKLSIFTSKGSSLLNMWRLGADNTNTAALALANTVYLMEKNER